MTNYFNESQALYMTNTMLNLSFEGVTVSSIVYVEDFLVMCLL